MSTTNARLYQTELDRRICDAWTAGAQTVLAVLPTGAGKTFLFSGIISREPGLSCAIAHRRELVGQMALALNSRGVPHFAIAPDSVVRGIVALEHAEHGRSFYDPSARAAVASVDTLTSKSRAARMASWCQRVALCVMDEGHHVTRDNKWGRGLRMFPAARGLLVTATPERADGRGLGRHADGVVDVMLEGPTGRELIDAGYLCDYTIYGPPASIDTTGIDISKTTGDFNRDQLTARARQQQTRVVGDVVSHYLQHAAGRLGVTFSTDVETATATAKGYRDAGVPAEVITAKTPDAVRSECLRRLRRGDIKQLVNVDIFGEGFDLPAIEVVSMARPTASYNLYVQQFGRGLRVMEGKDRAIILDHAGNVMRHGRLPDAGKAWTLDRREKRGGGGGGVPLRNCPACTGVYLATWPACPYCGHEPIPRGRSLPEHVDGDLLQLDPAALAKLRGEIERVDKPAEQVREAMARAGAPAIAGAGAAKQHRLRQEAQAALREAIAWWAGHQRTAGRSDSESYKRFFWSFGVDVATAQALGRPEAEALTEKIYGGLWNA